MIDSIARRNLLAALSIASVLFWACDRSHLGQNTNAANANAAQNMNSASASPAKLPVLEGYHDITNCNGIMGWAWDRNRPDDPIQINIYDGDNLLATVTADEFREDLAKAGIGNGQHGFLYPVPPRLKDGKPHSIRMKFADTGKDLRSTPKAITCTFEQ